MNFRFHARHAARGLAAALALLLLFPGCGPGDDDRARDDDDATPSLREGIAGARDAARGMRDAFDGMRDGGDGVAESVDFRQLRELLPSSAAGLDRSDASGERQNLGGFSISQAEAQYEDGDGSIKLRIVDAGGTGAFAMLGAAWMMTEFDRESSDGYERTTTFEGHRAYEKVDERRNRTELQFVVENRFFVSAEGRNVSMGDLQRAAREIDLRGLARMRDEGRQS